MRPLDFFVMPFTQTPILAPDILFNSAFIDDFIFSIVLNLLEIFF
ncbi:hypothetical protein SPONN_179 [uncultured Candidatus Thioglobus sp.]|nr:hypothetical protein SPONN_179 [uncultured Candidatus Thioglobus sp.]